VKLPPAKPSGKIGIVSVEHETRKVAAVPAAFLRRVADLKIA
jgi:hypothetical protein